MKKVILLVFLVSAGCVAQKVKKEKGDVKSLKGIAEFNLVFDYEGLTVDKFKTEEDFLEDKMKKREEKGTDEKFRESWFNDREKRYEPKFIESFNKRFDGKVKADKNLSSAKYTMKIQTIWLHPGYNIGISRSDSKLTARVTVFETANPSNVLFAAVYEKAPGAGAFGGDFDSGYRISEAYAKLGKELANDIK